MEPPLSYPSRSPGLIKEPHQASLLHFFLWKYLQYYLQSPKYRKGQFLSYWQSDKCKLPLGLCEALLLVLALIQK